MIGEKKVAHLVADSGAFICGAALQDIGENVYTTEEVIGEIRDKATRERLQFLPYELKVISAPEEDVKAIVDFSKKTGDYASLSLPDIKVMALTRYLERIHIGVDHLNCEPCKGKISTEKPQQTSTSQLVGFYDGKPKQQKDCAEDVKPKDGNTPQWDQDESNADECPNDHDDDTDEVGWITSSNVEAVKEAFTSLGLHETVEEKPKVALITTDFSMQNCLLQIGLKLVSVDGGKVIKYTKQWALRCHACYKVTNDLERKFCPSCGNLHTLKRVAVSVNEKGEKVYHINFRRPINTRNLMYSNPRPQSGKHANNQVVFEDQRIPQHKASKFALEQKRVADMADSNCLNGSNPFALNDVYSRASRHNNLPGKASNHVTKVSRNGRQAGSRKK